VAYRRVPAQPAFEPEAIGMGEIQVAEATLGARDPEGPEGRIELGCVDDLRHIVTIPSRPFVTKDAVK
jgi:hypothetical protein